MIDRALLESGLNELPLYIYTHIDPATLEFADRIRWICQHECPMYGKSWACPPGVGEVSQCESKCRSYVNCLLISTITEVSDISDLYETLATRPEHEAITNQVRDLFRAQGIEPYILSTEACAHCEQCAWPDGPCRFSDQMFPCVESHGILVTDLAERYGIEFMNGGTIVTWYSLLLYREKP